MLVGTLLVSGSSGIVLCVGDDGHFAVEPAHTGGCDRTDSAVGGAHGETALSVVNSGVSGVGACVDVSLGLDNVSHVVKDVRHDRLLKTSFSKSLSAGYAAMTFADGRSPRISAFAATHGTSQALQAQRTIVLRI